MFNNTSFFVCFVFIAFVFANKCSYTATNGNVYDFSPLIGVQSTVSDAPHKDSAYFAFGICGPAVLCNGSGACSLSTEFSQLSSLGRVEDQYWTEDDSSISLVYTQGDSCDNEEESKFVISFECAENIEYELGDFSANCPENRVIVRTMYACSGNDEDIIVESPSSSSDSNIESSETSHINVTLIIFCVTLFVIVLFFLFAYLMFAAISLVKKSMEKKEMDEEPLTKEIIV